MAGLEVKSPVFGHIEEFLDSVSREGGSQYAYRVRDGATLSLSAEGLLCREYLGWKHDDPRLDTGVDYLLANLPDWDERNVYYWYYATQVLHHMEGKPWQTWNGEMRQADAREAGQERQGTRQLGPGRRPLGPRRRPALRHVSLAVHHGSLLPSLAALSDGRSHGWEVSRVAAVAGRRPAARFGAAGESNFRTAARRVDTALER